MLQFITITDKQKIFLHDRKADNMVALAKKVNAVDEDAYLKIEIRRF